jgi:hypothetical protein
MQLTYRIARIACLSALLWGALSGCATDSEGRDRASPRYRFVSLDQALPSGYGFFGAPMKVTNKRRVYLNAFACTDFCLLAIATVHKGVGRILHRNAQFFDVNENGLIGGSVVLDPELSIQQAALFADGAVLRLPRMPGEVTSWVQRVTDSGKVLVTWIDEAGQQHYYVYDDGKVTAVAVEGASIGMLDMNRHGIVSGTLSRPAGPDRAFRLNPFSGKLTVLEPLPTEPDAWGQGINHRGDVLGYSFINGGRERIGVWHGTRFTTYFVEGIPEFPTISNKLLWNERGEIVITETFPSGGDPNSYLVPRRGVRLRLADITDRLPFFWTLIEDINERGDIVGSGGPDYFSVDGNFLLERIEKDHRSSDEDDAVSE